MLYSYSILLQLVHHLLSNPNIKFKPPFSSPMAHNICRLFCGNWTLEEGDFHNKILLKKMGFSAFHWAFKVKIRSWFLIVVIGKPEHTSLRNRLESNLVPDHETMALRPWASISKMRSSRPRSLGTKIIGMILLRPGRPDLRQQSLDLETHARALNLRGRT